MSDKTRRRVLFTSRLAVCVVFLSIISPGLWQRFFGPHVVNYALLGKTESWIASEYGKP